jgi:hypothetical protein
LYIPGGPFFTGRVPRVPLQYIYRYRKAFCRDLTH